MKNFNTLKATTFVFILGASATCALALDAGDLTGWQTPLAAEFAELDASGNGLVLPNEASKNKAFSKKTFAAADVDHDGTIDEAEYIQYKTGNLSQNVS
jgi:hyperosmotically inducible protein